MADLLPNVQQQFFDNNGNPLASGKIYTYNSGTTTPKATYTDTGAGTPNANPVILDANGRAAIWLSGAYKIEIRTSADVVLRTVDAVQDYLSLIEAAQTVASDAASTVQVTASDGTFGRLDTKLAVTSGQGISKTTLNPAGDEKISLALDINSMTEDTSPDVSTDFVPTYDNSAATGKKVKLTNIAPFINGVLNGLTTSNNVSDATNDIDIAAGLATDDGNTTYMRLSAITKRLDANWAVGTNQGGLDTGAVANGTYHVWVINRPDTNVTDVLFSASPTSPTMPTNYTKKRRIASFIRSGGAILPYNQFGGEFILATPVLDINDGASGTTAKTGTLASIPTGLALKALLNTSVASNGTYLYVSALASADLAASTSAAPLASNGTGASSNNTAAVSVWTNTSAQFRYRSTVNDTVRFATLGWVDLRA